MTDHLPHRPAESSAAAVDSGPAASLPRDVDETPLVGEVVGTWLTHYTDLGNGCAIGLNGDFDVIMINPPRYLSPEAAIIAAAWLIEVADTGHRLKGGAGLPSRALDEIRSIIRNS